MQNTPIFVANCLAGLPNAEKLVPEGVVHLEAFVQSRLATARSRLQEFPKIMADAKADLLAWAAEQNAK